MEKPSYFSILTADVRYDRRLGKPNARELYSEITALSNKDGYCHASNGYFAKLYEIDNGTVSRWISTLEKCGYLEREIIYYEGTKQVKERRLYPISTPIGRKRNTPPQKKQEGVGSGANTPPLRKRKENNTSVNNTSKNSCSSKQLDETNAFVAYQLSGATHNNKTMTMLPDYVYRLGNDLVCHAIDIMSVQASHPNFSFLQRILDSYENAGITTVEQAIKMEEEFRKRREQRRQSNSYTKSKPTIERDLSNKRYGTDEELEAEFFGEA